MEPLVVSVNDARKMLGGVGRNKIYNLINDGELEAVKIGGRTLIPVAGIHALITSSPRIRPELLGGGND